MDTDLCRYPFIFKLTTMKKFIIIVFTLIAGCTLYAQNDMDITWQECYGGSSFEGEAHCLISQNGYLILGSTGSNDGDISFNHGNGDMWLMAVDSNGTLLWEKSYGGSGKENSSCIISDNNGFFYLGGWTSSNDGDVQSLHHGAWDRWVVKINSAGDIIWEKCYGGSYSDYASLFLLLDNGNILVYSATASNDGDVPVNYGYLDVWLTIINPEGEILKNKVFGNCDQNNILDIVQTSDGGFFFTSKTNTTDGMVEGEPHGGEDIWAVKLDSSFNIEWQKLYGGSKSESQGWGIKELDDGYFFLGSTNSNDGDVSGFHGIPGELSTDDIWAVRIDLTGNIIWQRCLGGSKWDYAVDLFQTDDEGFVIIAETNSSNGDVINNNSWSTYNDIWMVKLNENGNIEWSQCYGGKRSEYIFNDGAVKKSDDNYIIAGITKYNSGDVNCNLHGETDIWLFEIKDCSQYMPQIPNQPTGPDTLCYTTDSTSMYSINAATGAWGYEWKIEPEEAGTILQDSLSAYITWNQQYEGEVAVSARSYNDCGNSDWSEVKMTWVYNCVGIEEMETGNIWLRVYPNPTSARVVFAYQFADAKTEGVITVTDITGRIIKTIKVTGKQGQNIWDTRNVKPGLYFYTVSSSGMSKSGKLIIQ